MDLPVRDLGRIDAPLIVFGGVYGNLQALEALMTEAARLGVPPARCICTGDVAAYGADPQAVAEHLRAADVPTVMGNVEESLGFERADCGCGFDEGSACDTLSQQWFAYSAAAIDAKTRAWMRGLPRWIRFTMADKRVAVVHGAPSQINRFVYASTPEHEIANELQAADADAVLAGHSGLPFVRTVGARLWVNAGVVGLPANDGTPRVWYACLAPTAAGIKVELRSLDYDHVTAAQRMRQANLPGVYAEAVETGLWPDTEILPDAERAATGARLRPMATIWS